MDYFPKIGEVLNIPLDTFIVFSNNYCGCSGSTQYIMVNWVHPFFLKAVSAAIKEDNPNWWQAINGPFS